MEVTNPNVATDKAEAPAEEATQSETFAEVDFASLVDTEEEVVAEPETQPTEEEPSSAEETQEEVTAQTEETLEEVEEPVEEPQEEAVSPEETQEEVAQPEETTAEDIEQPTEEEIAKQVQEAEAKLLPGLEEYYSFSDEEVEQVQMEPAKYLPKMAAKVHFQAHMSAYKAIVDVLPQVLDRYMSNRQQVEQQNNAFYDRWHTLNKPEYRSVVEQSMKAYKMANPNASHENLIKGAGVLASVQLGLPIDAKEAKPAGKVKGSPAATPLKPSKPAVAKPINPGSAGVTKSPSSPGEDNLFAELTDLFMESNI